MTKCLYDYNAEELIRNKDTVQYRLTELEIKLMKKEGELLINTDFSKVLGKSRTNKEERDAYVNREMAKEKLARAEYENSIDILNDLIRLRQKEVKPE